MSQNRMWHILASKYLNKDVADEDEAYTRCKRYYCKNGSMKSLYQKKPSKIVPKKSGDKPKS